MDPETAWPPNPAPTVSDATKTLNEHYEEHSRQLKAAAGSERRSSLYSDRRSSLFSVPTDPERASATELDSDPQARAWNGHAKLYDRSMEPVTLVFAKEALKLAGFNGPVTTPSKLLDVGCGPGRFAVEAARQGFEVTAIDSADKMIKYAQKRIAKAQVNVTTAVNDGESLLGFSDDSFDIVTSHFGLTTFAEPAMAWEAVFRVLKPGGQLFLSTWRREGFPVAPAIYSLFHAVDRKVDASEQTQAPQGPPANHPGGTFDPVGADRLEHADSLKQDIEAVGFCNVQVFPVHHKASFSSGQECVELLLDNVFTALTLHHKDMRSVQICMAHYVDLVNKGINPFADRNVPLPPALEDGVSAENMAVWREPVVVPTTAHIAIAEKPL